MDQLRTLSHSAVLTLIAGWVLHIGKDVLIPVVFGAIVIYVVIGLAEALKRIPYLHRILPLQLRYALSILLISFFFFFILYLVISNRDSVLALAPQYNESLLATIQKIATVLRIEKEPTGETLRADLLGQINIQRLLGSMVFSVSSMAVSIIIILLYAVFLMNESQSFEKKLARISNNQKVIARVKQVALNINRKVGAYLMLKTLISIFLGAVSWIIMVLIGLEFAAFWAVLIIFLNFIPYIGSALGVALPVVMAIVQFGDSSQVLWLALALTMAQFFIGNFLDPFVMGNSLNLSPFAILVSLAIWAELWGIAGAFLAVPITAVLAIILSEFSNTRAIAVLLSRDGQI